MRRRGSRSRGFAIVFVVGMLALLSVLTTMFVQLCGIDNRLGGNYRLRVEAQLIAESGLSYACAMLERQVAGGPMAEEVLKSWGYDYENLARVTGDDAVNATLARKAFARPLRPEALDSPNVSGMVSSRASGLTGAYELRLADESGKLNLNDPNVPLRVPGDDPHGFGNGRLYGIVSILADRVLRRADGRTDRRAAQVPIALFLNPRVSRSAYPQDQFPSMDAVDKALAQAGLNTGEIERFHDYFTLWSWQDRDVIRPHLEVFGSPKSTRLAWHDFNSNTELSTAYNYVHAEISRDGDIPDTSHMLDLLGFPIANHLAIQATHYELEPRAPVNINTARLELIQALIQPLQGVFLEEGPAETQSSEHYGWWSTGLGAPDPNLFNMGRLRLTPLFSEEQAARLARALYDRIHGIENADLNDNWAMETGTSAYGQDWDDEQPRDAEGNLLPNPIETWEEFRHFLEYGLRGYAIAGESVSPRDEVWVGEGFGIASTHDDPQEYESFTEPHDAAEEIFGLRMTEVDAYRIGWYRDEYCRIALITPAPTLNWDRSGVIPWWNRYYARRLQDTVFANSNPNTLPNDYNPNANVYLTVDKNQLCGYTTEFCFEPTGVFRVDSRGWLATAAGDVIQAEASLYTVLRMFDLLRLTNQAQFLDGMTDAGQITNYVSSPALTADSYAYSFSGPSGPLSLQCYPEPLRNSGPGLAPERSRFDGCWLLADREVKTEKTSVIRALAHFNGNDSDALKLDLCDAPADSIPPPTGSLMTSLMNPASPSGAAARPSGNLHPDGVYCEMERTIGYSMKNLAADGVPEQGSVRFWLKPNYQVGASTRIRKLLSGVNKADGVFSRESFPVAYFLSNPNNPSQTPEGASGTANRWDVSLYSSYRRNWIPGRCIAFGWAWEILGNGDDETRRASFRIGRDISRTLTYDQGLPSFGSNSPFNYYEGHAWNHLVFAWHLFNNPPQVDGTAPCQYRQVSYYNGVRNDITHAWSGDGYDDTTTGFPPMSVAMQGFPAGAVLSWGERYGVETAINLASTPYYADATVDEIIFSPQGVIGDNSARRSTPEAALSWESGRYCSQQVAGEPLSSSSARGVYTSPYIPLGVRLGRDRGGFRLRSCSWTYYRARHNRRYGTGLTNATFDNVQGVSVNPADTQDPMIPFWIAGTPLAGGQLSRQWDPIAMDYVIQADGDDDGEPDFLSSMTGVNGLATYPGGSLPDASLLQQNPEWFRYAPEQAFRFRVRWYLKQAQPLYESPVLDDVTFTFWRSRPGILEYGVRLDAPDHADAAAVEDPDLGDGFR